MDDPLVKFVDLINWEPREFNAIEHRVVLESLRDLDAMYDWLLENIGDRVSKTWGWCFGVFEGCIRMVLTFTLLEHKLAFQMTWGIGA